MLLNLLWSLRLNLLSSSIKINYLSAAMPGTGTMIFGDQYSGIWDILFNRQVFSQDVIMHLQKKRQVELQKFIFFIKHLEGDTHRKFKMYQSVYKMFEGLLFGIYGLLTRMRQYIYRQLIMPFFVK